MIPLGYLHVAWYGQRLVSSNFEFTSEIYVFYGCNPCKLRWIAIHVFLRCNNCRGICCGCRFFFLPFYCCCFYFLFISIWFLLAYSNLFTQQCKVRRFLFHQSFFFYINVDWRLLRLKPIIFLPYIIFSHIILKWRTGFWFYLIQYILFHL